jgi:hypothetical protein
MVIVAFAETCIAVSTVITVRFLAEAYCGVRVCTH